MYGQPDPEEGSRPLIDVHQNVGLGMALKCDGKWRGPRARGDTRVLDALSSKLVNERGSEGLRYIHRIEPL